MMEFGFQVYDENRQLMVVSTSSMEPPWLPRWMALVYMAAGKRGGCLDAAGKLHGWVKDIPAFTDVVHTQFWTPSSPWLQGDDPKTKRLNELGILMTEDIKVGSFLLSRCKLLISESFAIAILDSWTTTITER
jgi:hypothetical protein